MGLQFGTPKFGKIFSFLCVYLLINFVGRAQKVKKFEFWRARLGETPIVASPIFVRFSLNLTSTYSKILTYPALTV